MKLGNINGRAVIIEGDKALDVAEASGGKFSHSTREVLNNWSAFTAWAASADASTGKTFAPADLDAPVDNPSQVFAIGLNYKDHADEASLPYPEHIIIFTKFQSSLGAPNVTVQLPSDDVDYETEMVVVIGKEAHNVSEADAWDHVAGLCIGQDYSERTVQRRGPAAQFSLGKSYTNFGPYGPYIVTPDEVPNKDALRITGVLEGAGLDEPLTVQDGTTADLIFNVPRAIADLSQIVTLRPGDLIFTGTCAGVGLSRNLMLRPGQRLTSTLEGVGTISNAFV